MRRGRRVFTLSFKNSHSEEAEATEESVSASPITDSSLRSE
jgi:hypothetical protein